MDSNPTQPGVQARRQRLGLRLKVAVLLSVSAFMVAAILVGAFRLQMKSLLREEMEKRGQAFGLEVSERLAFAIFSSDTKGLQAAVEENLRLVPDLTYLVVRGANDEVLASGFAGGLKDQQGLLDKLPKPDPGKGVVGTGAVTEMNALPVLPLKAQVRFNKSAAADDLSLDPMLGEVAPTPAAAKPVIEQAAIGSVQIGFDVSPVDRKVASVTWLAIGLALIILLISIGAAVVAARVMTVPLERLTMAAAGIAAGDLQQKVAIDSQDEIGELSRSFGSMTERLRLVLGDLRGVATEVEREAQQILGTSAQQSAMASQQVTAINETSTTVSEIAQTSKQATEHADSVIKLAQKSEELSQDGQRVVEESLAGLEKLAEQVKAIANSITDLFERTRQIGDIISSVKEFAEQSNLLALNASIEAAKAGEHGRGFAVVAMEMHNLAEQSKVAAGQVRGILSEVQKGTRVAVAATEEGSKRAREAMDLAQRAGSSIIGLADVIRDSSLAARQIANNTRQQTIGVEQIVAAIAELSAGVTDALEGTKRVESVATNLTTVSKRLSELVGHYKV